MDKFNVTKADQVQDILNWALAEKKTLKISGAGSKSALGRPVDGDAEVILSGLQGVQMYEPAELVMQAKAGSKLTEITQILRESSQQLAFAPPDYGPLLGGPAGQSTLGGVFACNLSGSPRIKAGAARDHLLGAEGFSGRGHAFKTGSRVIKNVTGYDLSKLITGSYGTLAVCTSLTFKVLPKPEKLRTVLIYGEDVSAAVKTMSDAMSSIHEVSATAYLPEIIAKRSGIDFVSDAGGAVTAFQVEGSAPSAEFRCAALRQLFGNRGSIEELHGARSAQFWSFTANAGAFVEDLEPVVWRISVPPSTAPAYLENIQAQLPQLEYYLDWAGGLIWLSLPSDTAGAGAPVLRENLKSGGHATLIRASADTRKAVAPFQPQNSVLSRISERIRDGFDPARILNPGKMYSAKDARN